MLHIVEPGSFPFVLVHLTYVGYFQWWNQGFCVFLIWEHGGLQWELYFLWAFFMKVKEGVVDVFKILGFFFSLHMINEGDYSMMKREEEENCKKNQVLMVHS